MFRNTIKPLDWAKAVYSVVLVAVFLLVSLATAQAATINLAWNAVTGATGYRVYQAETNETAVNLTTQHVTDASPVVANPTTGATTTATVSVAEGKTYYFAVKAYNSSSTSGFSNEAGKTVPAVAQAPVASFSASPTSGVVSLTVAFTGTSTGGAATAWSWNFGDGTTSTAQNPSKIYSSAGTYTVTLTATGSGGSNTATKTNYITVTAPPTTTKPTANFSANPTNGDTATTFTFTDASSGNVSAWSWTFGDGTTSTGKNAAKTYSNPGTYTVSLTATGPGGSDTATKTNYISVKDAPPLADFSASPTNATPSQAVQFTDSSNGKVTTWAWKLGDGTTSTAKNPARTYSKNGTYTVSLTATGPGGSDTATKTNYITVGATSGLVAAYGFEEASGTAVTDASGNGNNGTLKGATRTTGKFGKALSFNGSSNWVSIPDADSLDLTTAMTLEAWVYPKNLADRQPILAKQGTTAVSPNRGYMLSAGDYKDSGKVEVEVFKDEKSSSSLLSSTALNTSGWQHVAFVYQYVGNGTSKMTIYINGVARGSSTTAVGPVQKNAQPLDLGRYYWSSSYTRYFNGLIDEVRIYNRALSATEIQADMNKAVAF